MKGIEKWRALKHGPRGVGLVGSGKDETQRGSGCSKSCQKSCKKSLRPTFLHRGRE